MIWGERPETWQAPGARATEKVPERPTGTHGKSAGPGHQSVHGVLPLGDDPWT
jgi:hypothetical protein